MSTEALVAARYGQTASAPGLGGVPVVRSAALEATAATGAGSTYTFFRVPTNARILGMSKLYWDDLASTGSPTVDIGFNAVNGNITSDPDALNDGLDVTSAGSGSVVKDIANYGKTVWALLGLSADPGGLVDIVATVEDAAVNTGGTIAMELVYSID